MFGLNFRKNAPLSKLEKVQLKEIRANHDNVLFLNI